MDLAYDLKFEEMKKYIPFLENMIKRLESNTTASSNPRQAQLDKIRSLRDLLLDKKKRMKMENLLKCEQVLVNLYAKVEQRDALPGITLAEPTPHSNKKEDKDLEIVRNKLKTVTGLSDNKETLPEISRASEIEEICTPGSKEPALFQRRPNKPSITPSRGLPTSPNKSSSSKRNYTRVLVSPEPRNWKEDESKTEKPLFSRRSPRKSPKRYSPSRERKKEKKKSKQEKSKKTKGLNITLNVPEESLNSLNTKDILSRIMNCNDNDMDIETLREAKRQILSELKQTGAKYDDISDLLLKSYKKSRNKKKDDVEEGEISDSESEAIESIYGGLNNSQASSSKDATSDDKEKPRKIQICLVINSEDGKVSETGKVDEPVKPKPVETDATDFQMFGEHKVPEVKSDAGSKDEEPEPSKNLEDSKNDVQTEETNKESKTDAEEINPKPANFYKPIKEPDVSDESDKTLENKPSETTIITDSPVTTDKTPIPSPIKTKTPDVGTVTSQDTLISSSSKSEDVEIPLLHEPVPVIDKPKEDVVSEIDILQALKNEILSESLSIPGSEAGTPALHQPKLKKVANAQEIAPKKRISIEKYKEKSVLTPKPATPLFLKDKSKSSKDDPSKKQSLKLTMKECERFNFPTKLALDDDDSSDEETISINDIYDDIAPKSPDFEDSSDVACTPPVIIPEDPVNKISETVMPSREDVDMRTLPLPVAAVTAKASPSPVLSKVTPEAGSSDVKNQKPQLNQDKPKVQSDPRLRREQPINMERSPLLPNPSLFPNMTPNRTPNMTPSRTPSMTPIRNPSMTPNARTFEIDDNMPKKHVYAPLFTSYDPRERESSVAKDSYSANKDYVPNYNPLMDNESRKNRWDHDRDTNTSRKWDDRNPRSSSTQRDDLRYNDPHKGVDYYRKNTKYSVDRRDSGNRLDCPSTPVHPFGRSDCPAPSSNPFGLPNFMDTPLTPVHPFGRGDCPTTPIHPFGRSDCPPTPIHPFGRNECPTTPIHPFGRSDCPTTPSHPFGRSEGPSTPGHPFGRGDMPMTPSHPFGRSENVPRDPRLNRSAEYDKYYKNEKDRNYYRDRNSSGGYKPETQDRYHDSPDSYRQYREKGDRNDYRNDRYKYSSRDRNEHYNRERREPSMGRGGREPSIGRGGRAISREVDNERIFSRDRNYSHRPVNDNYYQNQNSKSSHDFEPRRGFYRERSVGRSGPDERPYRSTSRAPSVGRTAQHLSNDNTLSVKRDTGRSFTIDTSVNSTFQDFLDGKKIQVFDYSFDSRRQRAASVGRTFTRETSVGRTLPHKPMKHSFETVETTKRLDFRRASSVGRDVVGKEQKPLKDLKAEFKRFKEKADSKKMPDKPMIAPKLNAPENDRKSRKDAFENKTVENVKKSYSPRKNMRDPRLRRESNEAPKNKVDERSPKHVGIVYSSDNITKGTILGSGYGVKNYKIPKIKRPVEEEKVEKPEQQKTETQTKDVTEKSDVPKKPTSIKTDSDKKTGNKSTGKKSLSVKKELQPKVVIEKTPVDKSKSEKKEDNLKINQIKKQTEKLSEKKMKVNKNLSNKESVDTPLLQNMDIIENVSKRVTRLSKKSEQAQPAIKAKHKKAVIYDSDSDEETSQDGNKTTATPSSKEKPCTKELDNISQTADENTLDSQSVDNMDTSFGIDDLEMFSDNIVSDPVIDNINALIADLDNELGPTKIVTPTDFSNDLIENMLENITGKEDTKSLNEDEKLNDISEVITNDLNQSGGSLDMNVKKDALKESVATDCNKVLKKIDANDNNSQVQLPEKVVSKSEDSVHPFPVESSQPIDEKINSNEDVVTTSETSKVEVSNKVEDKKDDQSDVDGRSTPDSTINSNDIAQNRLSQESVPDSTNEAQNEAQSIVSSTRDSIETTSKDNAEPTSSNKDSASALGSIGSILDILQNKSKIKELLSMLGDQVSDNDKIKKKLEKLSEIVSDEEEESKDVPEVVQESENESKNKLENIEKYTEPKDAITTKEIADVDPKDSITESNEKMLLKEKSDTLEETNDTTDATEALEKESTDKEESASVENEPAKKLPNKPPRRVTKKRKFKKNPPNVAKRVTRSNFEPAKKPTKKKQSRELLKLQEDIKEMFMKDEILNATGIRMCRIAKLVDKKDQKEDNIPNSAPMVVIEKDKGIEALEELSSKTEKKKPKRKNKTKAQDPPVTEQKLNKSKPSKYKPGPKSKKKLAQKQVSDDPYEFESDSVSDMATDETNEKSIDDKGDSSGSDSESLASSKSFESSEVLTDLKKKPKRKRSAWKSGIIKPKNRKKKAEIKPTENLVTDVIPIPNKQITIPDFNCFTDKTYCFLKNISEYSCRLCVYTGEDIVAHYKESHPHSEIPLSRMDPQVAKEAIEQCEEVNFQAISKIPTDKYVCRFCYKEFLRKRKNMLESFFWHIVSMHTGEYKKLCSECVNTTTCPFNLDIPPPPKDIKGQLIGYICEKCNFTQISLENLKTHVIVRHNDEQTEVYTINLAVMSKKAMNKLLKEYNAGKITETESRVLRSTRSNQNMADTSDDHSDDTDTEHAIEPTTSIKPEKKRASSPIAKAANSYHTKITYENDDHSDASHTIETIPDIKIEKELVGDNNETFNTEADCQPELQPPGSDDLPQTEEIETFQASDDIFDYPHFKISYTDAGAKEYVCCINGNESHYKTNLLISMKRHVQTKHSEKWDGYCFVCKLIVTAQGQHSFKDCLQHFLDKHIDNFPVLEKPVEVAPEPVVEPPPKPYINVRPLSELISNDTPAEAETDQTILPKIESIVSLGTPSAERVASPITFPIVTEPEETNFKYEEVQAEVMSKKHQVVLDSMMKKEKLINVYKCAGRYCSFTSDSVEHALLHASTHNRVGGEGSLTCTYCNFDCSGNAIDLVMHVFKSHGSCPFVCGHCFYRSAARQSVTAHICKAHPGKPPRVLTSTVQIPSTANNQAMLPREVVVRYYVCPHVCKYRTYTAAKFCEHLSQRHSTETWHSCYICSVSAATALELVQHMKAHELNVYQCTWCVHGSDNEAQLLEHAAAAHPDKQPQAYLRLITSKDGTKEFRVLPLASFNKTDIYVEVVAPVTNDNPVREAERSIELETLIGHSTQMIEVAPTTQEAPAPEIRENIEGKPQTQDITILPSREETPPPMTVEERSRLPTPVLKIEPDEAITPEKYGNNTVETVVCLDSDDEDSRHTDTNTGPAETSQESVINLSDDDAMDMYEKMPLSRVLKCPLCQNILKTVAGFKKHTSSCLQNIHQPVKCGHCSHMAKDRDNLVYHYTLDHCATDMATCGVCKQRFTSIKLTRTHLKSVHKAPKVTVKTKMAGSGKVEYILHPCEARPVKRKLSASSEPAAKMKKYAPQDVDKLPINPILDESVFCALCEFSTKVRLNMVRHLQFHENQQPVPHTAPINPVPHLETNEMHFDRMVNLASSSVVTRGPDRPASAAVTVATHVTPEQAEKYPKLVPERQRYACGAYACSYISVDEELFKCHWTTLHANTDKFRCTHCSQQVQPDFSLIMEHIHMHDSSLYACSFCPYYHHRKDTVKAHVENYHLGKGTVVTVREEVAVSTLANPTSTTQSAPTMDLKPWQCGLCEFKSMLRQEIVEHCGKSHQSKMQYKCANCPYRTSTIENVTKHMTNSHPNREGEVFYYFYREGTVSDDDGTPRWKKQRQKLGLSDAEIKTEVAETSPSVAPQDASLTQLLVAPQKPVPAPTPPVLDLNIVKKEVSETPDSSMSVNMLCQKYGQFCEPNGLNYKCPLCQIVMEDTRDAMQSHLFEELRYRRWECGTCAYKAFHSAGLSDHIASEHRGQNQRPVRLPTDLAVETWVSALLGYQTTIIAKNKESLAKQKILTERPPRPAQPEPPKTQEPKAKPTMAELEKAFGPLGVPSNMAYCCPKCQVKIKDETGMRNHLENELTKIRWCCSKCTGTFQTYHEAQFHCKSAHAAQAARPREAERSPHIRSAWVQAVLQVQKLSMRCLPISGTPEPPAAPPAPEPPENSLLVVRYEERVPTPELAPLPPPPPRPDTEEVPTTSSTVAKKTTTFSKCPHCDYQSKYPHVVSEHIYRHYNLKPFWCTLCDFTGHKNVLQDHVKSAHGLEYKLELVRKVEIPDGPPTNYDLKMPKSNKILICLVCEKSFNEYETEHHHHPKRPATFARKGSVVVKCSVCAALLADVPALKGHFSRAHSSKPFDYAFHKLKGENDPKEYFCGHCNKKFNSIRGLRSHNGVHAPLPVKIANAPVIHVETNDSIFLDDDDEDLLPQKRKAEDDILPPPKRIAKKSTTKLPFQAVAKKSTTKLPFHSEPEEYTFYGTKPTPLEEYQNVSVLMSFCNTMVPFTMDKLSGVLKINPKVVLEDVEKRGSSSKLSDK